MKKVTAHDPENPEIQACNVCTERFTSQRTRVRCPFCNYTCCKQCTSTYIADLITPCCMSCKKGWNTMFLYTNLSKSWIEKDYKSHQKNHLFEHEMTKVPLTIEKIDTKIELEQEYHDLLVKQSKIEEQINELREQIRQIDPVSDEPIVRSESQKLVSETGSKKFIMPCPGKDCRGYLSTMYKCGLCNTTVCKDCFAIKTDSEHKCKPEDIATVEEIKKSTKPCPKCGSRIQKLSGCDQMFCTSCNTAFSWTSGKVILGNVHNPHYFEYLNRTGRGNTQSNPTEFQCGGIVGYAQVRYWTVSQESKFKTYALRTNTLVNKLTIGNIKLTTFQNLTTFLNNVSRFSGEIRDYKIRNINRPRNGDLRLKWIKKTIEKPVYLTTLARREKEYNFNIEECQLFRMIADVMNDFLNNMLSLCIIEDHEKIQEQLNILYSMICYYNTQMQKILKHFGYSRNNFILISGYHILNFTNIMPVE